MDLPIQPTLMKTTIKTTLAVLSVLTLNAFAGEASFNFEDPKGVNTIRFNLDAPLETISGTTNGVTGTLAFDASAPEKLSGSIVVDATSIKVPNPVMQDHIHSEGWINSKKFGEITFEIAKVANVKTTDKLITADLTGTFTLHGVSKEITVPVKLTYLPGKLAERSNGKMKGDLLVLRSKFSINRSEYGIKPGQATDKVAEEIEISLALAGYAAK